MSVAGTTVDGLLGAGILGSFACQMLRWLRVLQREHYLASSLPKFFGRWTGPRVASARTSRWWRWRPVTLSGVLLFAFVLTAALDSQRWAALCAVLYGTWCPVGLSIKGRTGPLDWTRRLRSVAGVASLIGLSVVLAGCFSDRVWIAPATVVIGVPFLLAATAWLLAPFENRVAKKFVVQASRRLARVDPLVVAITGSYGKTSTKNHLAVLLGDRDGVVASPRSFNNRAGLSRAINENLADGTTTFIAEMGTYGPGEIAALCSWCPPKVAVVTAIGPVHLERMKSLATIERAKYEITARASTVVLNVDDERLARWPQRLVGEGKRVRRAGSRNDDASVLVRERGDEWDVIVDGVLVASTSRVAGVQATNLACAIGAALEVGRSVEDVRARLSFIEPVMNRANVAVAPSGVTVIDDTFNANPASAGAALRLLTSLDVTGRRVVVTPGMIELGALQREENEALGAQVTSLGAELVIVGRTNAAALWRGARGEARRVDTRERAVQWVRGALVSGDGVLYLNDLPDHYP